MKTLLGFHPWSAIRGGSGALFVLHTSRAQRQKLHFPLPRLLPQSTARTFPIPPDDARQWVNRGDDAQRLSAIGQCCKLGESMAFFRNDTYSKKHHPKGRINHTS